MLLRKSKLWLKICKVSSLRRLFNGVLKHDPENHSFKMSRRQCCTVMGGSLSKLTLALEWKSEKVSGLLPCANRKGGSVWPGVKSPTSHLLDELSVPTAHQQASGALQFKRTRRPFGLEANVLISTLTVDLLRRNLTEGHVWHKAKQGEQMFVTNSP